MRNGLIAIVAAGAIVAVAIVEGIRTNRWGASEDITAAAGKLERIPMNIGPWEGTDTPIDDKSYRVSEAVGSVSRSYVNSKIGERVNVLLLCGPTGPIAAHTPDVCYRGMGFTCQGKPNRKSLVLPSNLSASFWTARFEKKSLNDVAEKIYWAWSTNGDWEAVNEPRTDFALRSVLYKLYLTRADGPVNQAHDSRKDPIDLFLEDFAPIVKTVLN